MSEHIIQEAAERFRELALALRYNRRALDNREIKRLYLVEKWSAARVAAHYGCDRETITERLKATGAEIRPPGRYSAEFCHCGRKAFKEKRHNGGAMCRLHRALAHSKASRECQKRKRAMRAYKAEKQREYRRRAER